MPFVTVKYNADSALVSGLAIEKLMKLLPEIVAANIRSNIQSEAPDPKGVIVDAAYYHANAVNAPLIEIHISLKEKYARQDRVVTIKTGIIEAIRDKLLIEENVSLNVLIGTGQMTVTVDVVTRAHGSV